MTAAGRFGGWGHDSSGLVLGGHVLGPGLQWVPGLPEAALGTSFLSEEVVRLLRAPWRRFPGGPQQDVTLKEAGESLGPREGGPAELG